MGNRHAKAVILVEDDASMAQALSRNLQLAGFDVVAHRSAETLLEAGFDEGVLWMIIDIHLPGIDAFALLDRLSMRGGVPPAIVITAFDSPGARAGGQGGRRGIPAQAVRAPCAARRDRRHSQSRKRFMSQMCRRIAGLLGALALAPLTAAHAQQAGSDAELATKLSNPVASMISVPLQYNWDHEFGDTRDGHKSTLNIQPVVPTELPGNWTLISRVIVPLVDQHIPFLGDGSQSGVGDITGEFFFVPKSDPGGVIWGAGPAMLLPTHSDDISAGGAKEFNVGGRIVAGLDADADLVFFAPTYVFADPVAGGQGALTLAWAAGRMRASVDATLTGPQGNSLERRVGDSVDGGSDLYFKGQITWADGVNNWGVYAMGDIATGAYQVGRLANIGINHYAIDGDGMYTYFDPKKGHEFSATAGFTYNFENHDTDYNAYFIYAAQTGAAMFAATFKDFPPIQRPGSFTIDDAVAKMADASAGAS